MKRDARVKQDIFPVEIFIITFIVFGFISTIQMKVLESIIDVSAVASRDVFAVFVLWLLVAAAFTLVTSYQIRVRYQRPIESFAEAARQVAAGDFSVYVPPRHTADKADYLDVIFTDFNKMVEELGSIETLKTDFVSNVSHELKTPLAVISHNAQLLCRSSIEAGERAECAEAVLSAVERLTALIENILRLNKLEKQTISPIPERFDLSTQLVECLLGFEDVWETHSIELEADIPDGIEISADAGLLAHVWTNLLSNAFKFTPRGGRVRLSLATADDVVIVTVADTGCGMDDTTRRHIFDKFYQGDTSHASEGNGLGLPLVRRILQLANGTVTVKSAPGEGSEFTVTLPRDFDNGDERDGNV